LSNISTEAFFEHFSQLNENNVEIDENFDFNTITDYNVDLNSEITDSEILFSINHLSNNKACSAYDNILNEYLKYSKNIMLPILRKLFNVILESTFIPETWCKGVIFPIYKKKGDVNNPDNYRGITILSCFGKLFTSILNNRLNTFLESSGLLCEEQAGFRKNYGTVDHIFTLKMLIDFYLSKNKKLYCAFVDYKKAFDSVNRACLWKKLLDHNIDGKIFRIIYNIYDKAKSCVKGNHGLTAFFASSTGVRQGENLSPILFSIFLNDLVQHISTSYKGLSVLSESINTVLSDDTVEVYVKLFLLLYADDTVIIAESISDLQSALNAMYVYCDNWKLEVNASKTKVVIFSKGKCKILPTFYFNGTKLDIVEDFSYLGIKFNYNGRFNKTTKHLSDQARKAMFSVLKKSRTLCLDIDLQLHLFDTLVTPVLLYGCEIWGVNDVNIIQQFQLKYLKQLLSMKKSTPNVMVFGELGVLPIENIIKCRVLNFWCNIVNSKSDKICNIVYRLMYFLDYQNLYHSPWITFVKNSLQNLGFADYWLNQSVQNPTAFKNIIKNRVKDQYIQMWNEQLENSSKCSTYRMFKSVFELEPYFKLLPKHLALSFCQFRCSNHNLPIEKGRFLHLQRNLRVCEVCTNSQKLGDEFHYIFECPTFSVDRRKYIPATFRRPNMINFNNLFTSDNRLTLLKLAIFVKKIMKTIK